MVERFQSASRNDHERGMIAEANPTRLCFTLRDASLINEFSLVSILMQHLTLLTISFLSHYHTSLQILELQFSIIIFFKNVQCSAGWYCLVVDFSLCFENIDHFKALRHSIFFYNFAAQFDQNGKILTFSVINLVNISETLLVRITKLSQ